MSPLGPTSVEGVRHSRWRVLSLGIRHHLASDRQHDRWVRARILDRMDVAAASMLKPIKGAIESVVTVAVRLKVYGFFFVIEGGMRPCEKRRMPHP